MLLGSKMSLSAYLHSVISCCFAALKRHLPKVDGFLLCVLDLNFYLE